MVDNVLVPVDGSELSERALAFALDEFDDARVTLLYVVHPSDTVHEEGEVVDVSEVLMGKSSEVLRSYEEPDETDFERKLVVGREEDDGIVRYAEDEENEIDAIVMGSHGRTGVSRVLLGSVAEGVLRHAPTHVTIVR